ncbi:S8 family serine peptidase [Shewanella livingstonensis]|uniref:GlyGly-CTERM sorting domain-containing protein n=1 Tax=Shewanella livingstonensis TaxID=150120 RepID=A0A3G8LR45_9GAMM|nr:S8 family serine peptidase [Shewanella livingstonensis]AZG72011.1 GlyGly-CTERM sorting domain-containing protein [Shewanella livingstonensis]
MKTKLALAISAVLVSGACFAEPANKYNTTNQANDEYAGLKVSKAEKQSTVSAWMIKLNTQSVSQQARLSKVSSTQASISIKQSQSRVLSAIESLGADIQVVGQTSNLVNSILVKADKNQLMALLNNSEVADILPIYDYELDVADSADYIGATAVIEAGIASGKGQKVAVLDTGVDYTHKALGGSGLIADYQAAVAAKADMPNWPQGKVAGGYDFINNDPNPIDVDTNHGTHVSHSVVGIAPDVELYVYSVCNSGCPGLAQLNALEAAMDPNGDGDITDRVNTVNMSLGGDFGDTKGGAVQELIDEMVELGVNLVISAGNDGATPFVVGGPSTSVNALSVGAMTHPTTPVGKIDATAAGVELTAVAASFNTTNTYSFDSTTAKLVVPTTNLNGCTAFASDVDFTGLIPIIDRGACNFTSKVLNAQAKGAPFVIVANNAAGAGASAMGGSDPLVTIPSVMISKEEGDALKAEIAKGDVAFSITSVEVTTAGAIATFTSRGPSIAGTLKPEITAPGTSIMTAHPGLGDGLSPISGTSFSSPITAGAMSIVKEALPNRSALEIKATMMNAANLNVTIEPIGLNADAELAPISYIGAGLVDIEKSINLPVIAYDKTTMQAALAFGLVSLSETTSMTKTISVKNFSSETKTYTLMAEQRFQNDIDSAAVSFDMPASIKILAGQTKMFDVTVTIDPTKLPEWTLTSSYELDGDAEDASTALTLSEYDGAIKFMDGEEQALHVVYHILPKAAAAASVSTEVTADGIVRTLTNVGATAITAPFSAPLIATSPKNMAIRHDLINASSELSGSGSCDEGLAIWNTFQMRDPIVHGLVASYNVDYDLDNDGSWDYTSTTVNLQWFNDAYPRAFYGFVAPFGSGNGTLEPAYHVTGNNFLTTKVCFEDMGLTAADLGNSVGVRFRVEEADYSPNPTGSGDETEGTLALVGPDASAGLVDAEGEAVSELQPGESAMLVSQVGDNSLGYMLLSENGAMSVVANTTDAGNVAPTVEDLVVYVDKGAAAGTELGQVMATDPDMLTSPVSEFIVMSSNSSMFMIDNKGKVSLSATAVIDQMSETMEAQVIAIDTMGNRSKPAMVSVMINNTKPTVAPTGMTSTEGFVVTAKANGKDADGDTLTYNWVQTSGTTVAFSNGGPAISFTAPSGDNTIKFSVTASDTRLESDAGTATVTVTKKEEKSSGGSMGWLTALLLPLAALRRRKH